MRRKRFSKTRGCRKCFGYSVLTLLLGALFSNTGAAQNRQGQGGARGAGRPTDFDFFKDMPMLQVLDKDGNGELSFAELEAAGERLKQLDQNGDKVLSLEEVRPSVRGGTQGRARVETPQRRGGGRPEGGGRPQGGNRQGGGGARRGNGPLPGGDPVPESTVTERIDRLMNLDENSDGMLSAAEAGAALIEKADTDGDEQASRSEISSIVREEANQR